MTRFILAAMLLAAEGTAMGQTPRVTIVDNGGGPVSIRNIDAVQHGDRLLVTGTVRRVRDKFGQNDGCIRIEALRAGAVVEKADACWWPFAHRYSAISRFSARLHRGAGEIDEIRAVPL